MVLKDVEAFGQNQPAQQSGQIVTEVLVLL
jgi:hypothetical protein